MGGGDERKAPEMTTARTHLWAEEQKRKQEIIGFSDRIGERELLTVKTARKLYGGAARSRVTKALDRHPDAVVFHRENDNSRLIRLASLIEMWGAPDAEVLERMRGRGVTMGYHGGWLILDEKPRIKSV